MLTNNIFGDGGVFQLANVKMLANNIFGDGGVFELANVNLALFGCGLKFENKKQ